MEGYSSSQESLPLKEEEFQVLINELKPEKDFLNDETQECMFAAYQYEEIGQIADSTTTPFAQLKQTAVVDPMWAESDVKPSSTIEIPDTADRPKVTSTPTGTCPSSEAWPGPYNFKLYLNPPATGAKMTWWYSLTLHKLYTAMNTWVPIMMEVNESSHSKKLYVRAMPVFDLTEYFDEPVVRCRNHQYIKDSSNEGFISVDHVIRINHTLAEYCKDEESKRLSVVVPLELPQAGSDTVMCLYKFMCKSSCMGGMNRRPIYVIFTLEENGIVVGRQIIHVRICSCPKRDIKKEEEMSMKTTKKKLSNKKRQDEEKTPAKRQRTDDCDNEVFYIPVLGRRRRERIMEMSEYFAIKDGYSNERIKEIFDYSRSNSVSSDTKAE